MTHLLAIIGLSLDTFGAVLLLSFPPRVRLYTKDGGELGLWKNAGTAEARRYRIQIWGFRTGMALLAAGFILQLLGLLFI